MPEFVYPRTAADVTDAMLAMPAEELKRLASHPLQVFPTKQDLYEYIAQLMADTIQSNNRQNKPTRWIVPIGPKNQYPILARLTNENRISWKNVWMFHMDDWLDWQGRPLPLDHPFSLRGYANRFLYDLIDPELRPPLEQIIFPDPYHLDSFSGSIAKFGGIDATFAGFGYRGHLAFNETPNNRWGRISSDEFAKGKTRIVHLLDDTLIAHSQRSTGGHTQIIPQMAITCGMADILASKTIHLLTDGGPWKQWMLRAFLLTTEPDSDYAITLCHKHPDVRVVCDAASAAPINVNQSFNAPINQ
jgi:glucosamine-6-phosphate deaminase